MTSDFKIGDKIRATYTSIYGDQIVDKVGTITKMNASSCFIESWKPGTRWVHRKNLSIVEYSIDRFPNIKQILKNSKEKYNMRWPLPGDTILVGTGPINY